MPLINSDAVILVVLQKCSLKMNDFITSLNQRLAVLVPESCTNTFKLESLPAKWLLTTQRNLSIDGKSVIPIDDVTCQILTKTYRGLNSSSAIIIDLDDFSSDIYQINWLHIVYTVVTLMFIGLFIISILFTKYDYRHRIDDDAFDDDDVEISTPFSRNHTMHMSEIDLMFPTRAYSTIKNKHVKNMQDSRSLDAKNSILSLYSLHSNVSLIEPIECSICLDTFNDDCVLRKLFCEHLFHKECIDLWLTRENAKCPLCNLEFYNAG